MRIASLCAAAVLLARGSDLAGAAAARKAEGGDSPFAAYEEELAKAPPPDWVEEGLRLTYDGLAGLTEADLVALTEKHSVLSIQIYSRMTPESPLTFSHSYGAIGYAGFGSEYWVEPRLLQKIAKELSQGDEVKVTRGPFRVRGESYATIRFDIGGGAGGTSQGVWVYEEATGLLLHLSRAMRTPFGVQPTIRLDFVRRRVRDLPWRMGRPPDWLFRVRQYVYSGEQVQQLPGAPPASVPIVSYHAVKEKGENWILYEQSVKTEGPWPTPPQKAPLPYTCGPTQVGGLWLPPLGLKGLRQGQVVDEDPETRIRVSVAHVGPTNYGREVVALLLEGPNYRATAEYETKNGILLRASIAHPDTGTLIQTRLTAKE